ncbi:MAG: S9 family peptidase [Deltaproteobacteria bacterium]|nr:S9 family peptidase [Deltaproteobacteria bacterium]
MKEALKAPQPEKKNHTTKIHGEILEDPYFWLREKENPQVTHYLEAENKYTESILEPEKELRENLFTELKSRILENESSVPQKDGEYYYYYRYEAGKEYEIYCRTPRHSGKSGNPQEEIILDLNELACGQKFFSLGGFALSSNHKLLAYSCDFDGSEKYTLFIKDLEGRTLAPEKIENTAGSIAWFNDHKTFLYSILDKNHRPYAVYKHCLGEDPKKDIKVYEEKTAEMFVGCHKTRSEKYLVLSIHGAMTQENHILDADDSNSKLRLIQKRKRGHEYYLAHHGEDFFILTNDLHPNFRVCKVHVDHPEQENWKEIIAPQKDVFIADIEAFKEHLIVFERKDALTFIKVINLVEAKEHYIHVDEPVYKLSLSTNPEFDTTILRYTLTSPTIPLKVFDYNMKTKTQELKKDKVVPNVDTSLYETERIYTTSWDGEKIPMDLVYKKGLKKNGNNPVYLYGYGAYGISIDPQFSSNRISILERGFIFALAHIRGGTEKGRYWYEDAKFLKKKNTFKDLVSSAEELISHNYTSKGKIVIVGGSAGGLLVGAVLNMKPELFKAVVAHVPFVDALNTMLDDTLPLTQIEYDEWGNPKDKEYFEYIKSYSPYDNLKEGEYPHILATGGLNDPRVCYWEPAKWIAKIRDLKKDKNYQLLYIKMGSGHFGASGRYEYLKDFALEYTFIFKVFGIKA